VRPGLSEACGRAWRGRPAGLGGGACGRAWRGVRLGLAGRAAGSRGICGRATFRLAGRAVRPAGRWPDSV